MTATPTTSDTLATLLAAKATTYTVRFNHDGTWEVLLSGTAVYRGSQRECLTWLDNQAAA